MPIPLSVLFHAAIGEYKIFLHSNISISSIVTFYFVKNIKFSELCKQKLKMRIVDLTYLSSDVAS